MGRREALMQPLQIVPGLTLIGKRHPVLIELDVAAAIAGAEKLRAHRCLPASRRWLQLQGVNALGGIHRVRAAGEAEEVRQFVHRAVGCCVYRIHLL